MNMGNPKRASRFLCCKHLGENFIGQGIQRKGKQRPKYHLKDIFCIQCQSITKNIEVRWCDDYLDIYEKAREIHKELYINRE
jgi:hypothetical protein|nr:MAG TPA: hypothetical protein [Caudoviricetes sp.]